jgi:hypothetical protein
MRVAAALIAGAIAASACATTQADASPPRPRCASYPNTVVANGQVKVDDPDAGGVRLIRLAGRHVAFEYHLCFTIYCVPPSSG